MEFKEKFLVLDGNRNKKLKIRISCLNPNVGEDGFIRVGARLQQSNLDEKIMHPVMLPKKGTAWEVSKYGVISGPYFPVVGLSVFGHFSRSEESYQKCTQTVHSWRNVTLNEIRTFGYWVIQSHSAMKEVISKNVTSRRLRGELRNQII